MCFCVISASVYTSAGPLGLKQNGVLALVTTSGYRDSHTARSTHIGSGAGYCSFFVVSRVFRRTAEEAGLPASGSSRKRRDLFATE